MLTTPMLYQIPAFDADYDIQIPFNVIGGDVVQSNQMEIYYNDFLIYSSYQNNRNLYHTIPANTLENGNNYQIKVRTFSVLNPDESSVGSPFSNILIVKTRTSPTLSPQNYYNGITISGSNYTFNVLYEQAQGDLASTYQFKVYSVSGELVLSSGNLSNYDNDSDIISYFVSGLDNNTSYDIECIVTTVNMMQVSTGKIRFYIVYEGQISPYTISLKNNTDMGSITIISSLKLIDGNSTEQPTYIDDEYVELTNGNVVYWMCDISGNFKANLVGKNFITNKKVFWIENEAGDSIELYTRISPDNKIYFELLYVNDIYTFTICTDEILETSDDINVEIVRKNGLYQIEVL